MPDGAVLVAKGDVVIAALARDNRDRLRLGKELER
jgi:hypothetical protein